MNLALGKVCQWGFAARYLMFGVNVNVGMDAFRPCRFPSPMTDVIEDVDGWVSVPVPKVVDAAFRRDWASFRRNLHHRNGTAGKLVAGGKMEAAVVPDFRSASAVVVGVSQRNFLCCGQPLLACPPHRGYQTPKTHHHR